jgi:hypothetical protein
MLPSARSIEKANHDPLNRIAKVWLNKARAFDLMDGVHLHSLAWWGLDAANVDVPNMDRGVRQTYLPLTVGQMFDWQPQNWMNWLFSNLDAGEIEEQRDALLFALQVAECPSEAAIHVLEIIVARLQSELPLYQRTASSNL